MNNKFDIPKYKLALTQRIKREQALTYYIDFITEKILFNDKEAYRLNDDSIIILHQDKDIDFIYIELHCNIAVDQKDKSISFPAIDRFIQFGQEIKSDIKILRNKQVGPASKGYVMSDFYHSEAFKKAIHESSQNISK